MDHDRYAELIDSWNFYGGHTLYDYPAYPVQQVKAMYAQWELRNKGMCARIVGQLREAKAQKVVVAVGAAHRKALQAILSKEADIEIVRYGSL